MVRAWHVSQAGRVIRAGRLAGSRGAAGDGDDHDCPGAVSRRARLPGLPEQQHADQERARLLVDQSVAGHEHVPAEQPGHASRVAALEEKAGGPGPQRVEPGLEETADGRPHTRVVAQVPGRILAGQLELTEGGQDGSRVLRCGHLSGHHE
jgi:hypothetical protein